jgi:hypothetical protein
MNRKFQYFYISPQVLDLIPEKIKNGKTKEHRQQKVAFQINGSKKE